MYICCECVEDPFLSAEISDSGLLNTCMECDEKSNICWSISELAERVKEVFESNYELTASEPEAWQTALIHDKESTYWWFRDGESPESLVAEMCGTSSDISEAIVEYWNNHQPGSLSDLWGTDNPYGGEALYEKVGPSHGEIETQWEKIQTNLLHRSRFFNHSIGEFFARLFTGIDQLGGYGGPVIETYSPGKFPGIYRARVAYEEEDLRTILEGLPAQLSALRGRAVVAGRMNAAGVTVMYGALDETTCIAEVRAPVGAYVVIGKFDLLRPLRILNLERLERCYVDVSLFDPDAQQTLDRMAFLRSLSRRLSSPVFNHNAHLDYLATQCIAEYIATMDAQIDGVAFASAQSGGDAINVVLFDHACHVAPLPYPPGTRCEVCPGYDDEGVPDGTRNLVFHHGSDTSESTVDLNVADENENVGFLFMSDDKIDSTLTLDLDSIQVHRVTAVKYSADSSKVWIPG